MLFRFKIHRYLHQVLSGKWSEKKYFRKLTKLLKHMNQPPPKEKRYCKGCLSEVTEGMFCFCGEFYLDKQNTYSEEEMRNMEPPEYRHKCIHPDLKREYIAFAICLFSIFVIILILSFL